VPLLFLLASCGAGPAQTSGTVTDLTRTPVFFIHGLGVSETVWDGMIAYLHNSGYPPQFLRTIQLFPGDGSNIDAAEKQIAPAVEKFLEDVNSFIVSSNPEIPKKGKIDLVSHSMGALSSRWYAAKVRPDRVRTWISLAGANHGSNAACRFLGKWGQGGEDLCPAFATNEGESRVQFVLNGAPRLADVDETPFGIGSDSPGARAIVPDTARKIFYVTIRTVNDKWIVPGESAILDGAGGLPIPIPNGLSATERPAGNIRMENGVLHDPMLWDPSVMRLVRTILGIDTSG
jgi:pimeloyl-ACP methyl ester carboxylesterase